jgi:heme iron utilization protein
VRDYCRLQGVATDGQAPQLSAIDAEGFDVMLDKRLLRIDFDTPVAAPGDVRKAMVELARRARAAAA